MSRARSRWATGLLAVALLLVPASPADTVFQEGDLTAPGMKAVQAVDLDGDTLVVSSGATDSPAAVFAYIRSGSGWQQQATITATDVGAKSSFGTQVAVSGDYMVATQPDYWGKKGKAFLFARSGTTWSLVQTLVAEAANDGFPWGVALDGETLVLGAPNSMSGGVPAGAVLVYDRGTDGVWLLTATLRGPDPSVYYGFGAESLVLAGDLLFIGDSSDPVEVGGKWLFGAGAVYVYRRGPSGWVPEPRWVEPEPIVGGLFGKAVAVAGDLALVTARFPSNPDARVYVYEHAVGGWSVTGSVPSPIYTTSEEQFGAAIAVAPDDPTVWAVSAGRSVLLYEESGTEWVPSSAIFRPDLYPVETMTMLGSTLAVGQGAGVLIYNMGPGCGGRPATIPGTTGDDVIAGTPGDDVIDGGGGNDIIDGGGGNDVICGGLGDDRLNGGPGSDLLDGGYDLEDAAGDTADYSSADAGVSASVGTGMATGGGGDDTLIDIENLTGGPYGDTLEGDDGMNVLEGGGGSDTLIGGEHEDILRGGPGDDTLRGGPSDDTLAGDAGDDTADYSTALSSVRVSLRTGAVSGKDGVDELSSIENLTGGRGNDVLEGNGKANRLVGGAGDDVLKGLGGDDLLDGGADSDTADFTTAPGPIVVDCGAGTASGAGVDLLVGIETVLGSAYDDEMTGDAASNMLDGNQGDDMLWGMGGNDALIGADGDDGLWGGEGDDSLAGEEGLDFLVGGPGDDRLFGGADEDAASFEASPGPVTVNLVDESALGEGSDFIFGDIEDVIGTEFDDTIVGSGDDNVLIGLGGADVIDAGPGGYDLLVGGGGNDTLTGDKFDAVSFETATRRVVVNLARGTASGEGSDKVIGVGGVVGSAFGDRLVGNGAANTLIGLGGNDTLEGGAGNDLLMGGRGNDDLRGGGSDDLLLGEAGEDALNGGLGSDTASFELSPRRVVVDLAAGTSTGEGSDSLTGIENLVGSALNDSLRGNEAGNTLLGLAGADSMFGRGGQDLLVGGDGKDSLYGGPDVDTVSFELSAAGVIADLTAGTASGEGGDRLYEFENAVGSAFGDTLRGTGGPNTLAGLAGNDALYGLAGNDVLGGGAGNDLADGDGGTDECIQAETTVSCERIGARPRMAQEVPSVVNLPRLFGAAPGVASIPWRLRAAAPIPERFGAR